MANIRKSSRQKTFFLQNLTFEFDQCVVLGTKNKLTIILSPPQKVTRTKVGKTRLMQKDENDRVIHYKLNTLNLIYLGVKKRSMKKYEKVQGGRIKIEHIEFVINVCCTIHFLFC